MDSFVHLRYSAADVVVDNFRSPPALIEFALSILYSGKEEGAAFARGRGCCDSAGRDEWCHANAEEDGDPLGKRRPRSIGGYGLMTGGRLVACLRARAHWSQLPMFDDGEVSFVMAAPTGGRQQTACSQRRRPSSEVGRRLP